MSNRILDPYKFEYQTMFRNEIRITVIPHMCDEVTKCTKDFKIYISEKTWDFTVRLGTF